MNDVGIFKRGEGQKSRKKLMPYSKKSGDLGEEGVKKSGKIGHIIDGRYPSNLIDYHYFNQSSSIVINHMPKKQGLFIRLNIFCSHSIFLYFV